MTIDEMSSGNTTGSAQDTASSDWQSSKHNLKDRFTYIFDNKLYSDFYFIVGSEEPKKIPANKLVLSAGSPVFHTLFNGNWAPSESEIEVPDIEPAVFQELLRFLYSDEIAITIDTAAALMYAARKYAITAVEDRCANFLVENLRLDNVFRLLAQARLFDVQKLVEVCFKMIDDGTDSVVQAEDFCNIDIGTLCLILERDTLNIRESKLFEAVLRWSETKCRRENLPVNPENRKAVLKQALPSIRYPLMSAEEFASTVPDSGLLSESEQLQMLLYFSKKNKPTVRYNKTPRKGSSCTP